MRHPGKFDVNETLAEFDGDSLGDARLDERLRRIVSLAATDPGESFPEQMASIADREALYRFLANPKVTMAGVLSGHVRQTHERIREHPIVRIVHDTKEPLGVVGLHPYIHQEAVAHQGMTPSQRVLATRAKPRAAKESARWEQMA